MKVVNVKPLAGAGNLKAVATVQIGRVLIHDFRIVQQPGQNVYVQPPLRSWVKDGKQQFGGPLVELPEDILDDARNAVMAAWKGLQ